MQPLRMQPIGEPLAPEELEEEMEEVLADLGEGGNRFDIVASDSEDDAVTGNELEEHAEQVPVTQYGRPRPKRMMSIAWWLPTSLMKTWMGRWKSWKELSTSGTLK